MSTVKNSAVSAIYLLVLAVCFVYLVTRDFSLALLRRIFPLQAPEIFAPFAPIAMPEVFLGNLAGSISLSK